MPPLLHLSVLVMYTCTSLCTIVFCNFLHEKKVTNGLQSSYKGYKAKVTIVVQQCWTESSTPRRITGIKKNCPTVLDKASTPRQITGINNVVQQCWTEAQHRAILLVSKKPAEAG